MPDSIQSRPLLKIGIAAVGILLGLVAIGVLSDFVDADSTPTTGSGTLTVAGETYAFTPTTCFVSSEDFVAAGPGIHAADRFWISASSVSVDLAFGTDSEVDQPADDQRWLMSDEAIQWNASGQRVVAATAMTDRRDPDSPSHLATFEVQCVDDS